MMSLGKRKIVGSVSFSFKIGEDVDDILSRATFIATNFDKGVIPKLKIGEIYDVMCGSELLKMKVISMSSEQITFQEI